jgi:hypothetical protein
MAYGHMLVKMATMPARVFIVIFKLFNNASTFF